MRCIIVKFRRLLPKLIVACIGVLIAVTSCVGQESPTDRRVETTTVRSGKQGPVTETLVTMMRPHRADVLTITVDNGREFVRHEAFAKALDADVYFAHPYHSWERGTNENANGLVR